VSQKIDVHDDNVPKKMFQDQRFFMFFGKFESLQGMLRLFANVKKDKNLWARRGGKGGRRPP
jgi:hypothetical protein